MKVIVLTRGGLTDVRTFFLSEAWCKACREKSAETIVVIPQAVSQWLKMEVLEDGEGSNLAVGQ